MSPALILPARIASIASSSPSKTRAIPSNNRLSIPATFTTAPLGAMEPRRTAIPPCSWIGALSGCTTSPSGAGAARTARFSATVFPVTVTQSPWSNPASRSSCITTCTPPTRSRSVMWYFPCGFMSAMCGTRAPTRLKSSSSSSTPASLAMARRCRTALVDPPTAMVTAIAFSNASLVMICRGRIPARISSMTASTGFVRVVVAATVDRRSRRGSRQRHAERLRDRRHRVGGEHARARSLGGARALLDLTELVHRQRAGGTRPDGFEHADDVERLVLVVTGQDRAPVEEHRRHVGARRRHQHPGQALVAPGQRHERVESLRVHHALDGVGDDLAAHEGAAHAFVAHRDAVTHRNGDELHREPARGADAVFRTLGQAVEREVAGRDLVPARGHTDLRLVPVVVGHADRPQHGPRRRALHAVGDFVAVRLHRFLRVLRHAVQRTLEGSGLPRRECAHQGGADERSRRHRRRLPHLHLEGSALHRRSKVTASRHWRRGPTRRGSPSSTDGASGSTAPTASGRRSPPSTPT